ncbi:nucleotidyltransferase family protein [bacterium]|nr:nucleotidyltransferase family protein [bacterium]
MTQHVAQSAELILARLAGHSQELRELGVKRIGLFGSVVRGEARTDSDLDFLVDMQPRTFDSYFDLLEFLEALFECKIDLVMKDALHERLSPFVMGEVRYLEGL